MHNYTRDKKHAEGEIMNTVAKQTIEVLKDLGYEVAGEDWSIEQSTELTMASGLLSPAEFISAGFHIGMKPEEMRKITLGIYFDAFDKEMSALFGRA